MVRQNLKSFEMTKQGIMNKSILAALLFSTGTIVGCNTKSPTQQNQVMKPYGSSLAKPPGWDQPPAKKTPFKWNLDSTFCVENVGGKIVSDITRPVYATTASGQDTAYLAHDITVEMPDNKTQIIFRHAQQNKEGCVVSVPEPAKIKSPASGELHF